MINKFPIVLAPQVCYAVYMKLLDWQKTWIRNYELARANGVTFDANTQEYVPFDEIVVPD